MTDAGVDSGKDLFEWLRGDQAEPLHRDFFIISKLFSRNPALDQSAKQHQSCFAHAFSTALSARPKRRPGRRRFSRPKRLEQPKLAAVVDVEIRLSARWRALPRWHCSLRHYVERRRDADQDNCRLLRLVSWQVLL